MENLKLSDTTTNLFLSIATFHKEVETIKKSADNPFFKSVYAPLEEILPAIKTPLEKSGLDFVQLPNGDTYLTTIIFHIKSGEYMQASLKLSPVDNKPQSQGSAITYARRYMLVSMLGLNTDKDDDGNQASGNVATPRYEKVADKKAREEKEKTAKDNDEPPF